MGDNFNHIPATDTCVRQVSKSPIEVAVMLKYAVINKYILNDGINFPHSLSVILIFVSQYTTTTIKFAVV